MNMFLTRGSMRKNRYKIHLHTFYVVLTLHTYVKCIVHIFMKHSEHSIPFSTCNIMYCTQCTYNTLYQWR